ncbi:condensation domain-containing protein [Solwaraspora sp. WMMB335]|uniref:condensation domain-containing protein n=1 Tax=Solwaraspora sp. WMMB335 TaxID=3404118 RepID=UPI003B951E23
MSSRAHLVGILRETLEVDETAFDRSFLDAGGNSLRAALIVDAAESTGIDIGIDQLYRAPTLWAVVETVRSPGDGAPDALPLTRAQRALLEHTGPTRSRWRLAVLRPRGASGWNDQSLEVAARSVLSRYDALRVRLTVDGTPAQRITDPPVTEDVLTRIRLDGRPNGWDLHRLLPDPRQVGAVPLTHFVLLDHDGPDHPWLLVAIHPVVCDATSFDRAVRTLRSTVAVVLDGEPVVTQPARPTWRDWCTRQTDTGATGPEPGRAPNPGPPDGAGTSTAPDPAGRVVPGTSAAPPGTTVPSAVGTVLAQAHGMQELDIPVDDPTEDHAVTALGAPPGTDLVGCYATVPDRHVVPGGAPAAPARRRTTAVAVPEIRIRPPDRDSRVVTPPGTAAGLLVEVRVTADTVDLTWYVDERAHATAAVAATAHQVTGLLNRLDSRVTTAHTVVPTGADWAGAGDG